MFVTGAGEAYAADTPLSNINALHSISKLTTYNENTKYGNLKHSCY
jgi:hypothetical protein